MKKLTYTLFLLVVFGVNMLAKPVSEEQAKYASMVFFSQKNQTNLLQQPVSYEKIRLVDKKISQFVDSSNKTQSIASLYVFSESNNFVIIAGDDRMEPILAYSFNSTFNPNNLPPAVELLLQSYEQEIVSLVKNGVEPTEKIKSVWKDLLENSPQKSPAESSAVEPLIETHWAQSPYYNELCPDGAPTGCVATAMAQIMKYWNFPQRGKGEYSYYSDYTGGLLSANFQNATYKWCDMPNSVNAPNLSVATLMYHCGVAVDMMYGKDESGADATFVASAMQDYFYYDNTISFIWRDSVGTDTYKTIIKDEIDAGRPIFYGMSNGMAGHALVCDGYDSDYFHFNYGWGGESDGYYLISQLLRYQYMVTGIQPKPNVQFLDIQNNGNITISASEITANQPFTISYNVKNRGTLPFDGLLTLALFNKHTNQFVKWLDNAAAALQTGEAAEVDFNCNIDENGAYYIMCYFTNENYAENQPLTLDLNTNAVGNNCDLPDNYLSFDVGKYSFLVLDSKIEVSPVFNRWVNEMAASGNFYVKNSGNIAFDGTIKIALTDRNNNIVEEIDNINAIIAPNEQYSVYFKKENIKSMSGQYFLKCTATNQHGTTNTIFEYVSIVIMDYAAANSLDNFSVLPTLAVDFITIKKGLFAGQIYEIDIYNTNGIVVQKDYFDKQYAEKMLYVGDLSNGVYILVIKTSSGNFKMKFLKK